MLPYRPATSDLLSIVEQFLADLAPRLDAADRYDAIVCRHLLGIAAREQCAREGSAGDGGERTDDAALVKEIRAGVRDATLDPLLGDLLDRIAQRVRMTKPDHLAPRHQLSVAR